MNAPYQHIAVCVDDSEGSRRALKEALRLRALGPGRLSVVHVTIRPLMFRTEPSGALVVDPADQSEVAARWLADLVRAHPGAEAVVLHGESVGAVCEWARGAGVSLLIASAHRTRVERFRLGSFAAGLAHHAPCPVLLVRSPSTGRHRGGGEGP